MYVIIIVSFLALEIGGELSQGLCTQSSESCELGIPFIRFRIRLHRHGMVFY